MKIVLLLSVLFVSICGTAQNYTYRVGGKITNNDTKKMEAGVTVSFVGNGKVIASAVTASNGKYDLKANAPFNGSYQIVYSKPGFVSKKVAVTTAKINLEDVPGGSEFPLPTLDMDLFAEKPGADFSFLNSEPVASFFWDDSKMILNYDKDASAKTKKKIEDLLAAGANKEAENEAKYQTAVKSGESLFIQKKYPEALAKYEEAHLLKAKEAVPIAKIAEIDKLIKDQKTLASAAQAAEQEYNNLITAGNNLRDQKKYPEAIAKYSEALKKKEDAYPRGEITKLNAMIADQKAKEAKDLEFENLKKEGMVLAAAKKWSEAKAKLRAAEAIKADATITQKIKDIDAEMAKASSDSDKLAKYNAAMTMAEGLFRSGKYAEAKAKFSEASIIDSSQSEPKQRILDMNDLIAKQASAQANKAKIDKLMLEGNTAYTKSDFALAKIKYEEILKLDSSNALAIGKLKEIDAKLAAQKGVQADNQKEVLYNTHMGAGAKNMASKNYKGALSDFQNALSVKPNDPAAKEKINQVQKLLDDITNKQAQNADAKANLDRIVADADRLFKQNKFLEAKAQYEKALSLQGDHAKSLKQVAECQRKLDEDRNADEDKSYNKIISAADRKFLEKDYLKAKEYYERASKNRLTDPYPKTRLLEIERLLNSSKEVPKVSLPVEPEKLLPLGIPYNDSEEKAQADLRAAEIEREKVKNRKLKHGIQTVNDKSSELDAQKHEDHLGLTKELSNVQGDLEDKVIESHQKHLNTVEKVKTVEREQADFVRNAEEMENADHLQIQDKINIITNENNAAYKESEKAYMDKGTELKKHDSQLAAVNALQSKKYDDKSVATGDGIRLVEEILLAKQMDDKEERLAADERTHRVIQKTVDLDMEMNRSEIQQNLDTKGKLAAAEREMGEKLELDLLNSGELAVNLEKVKHDVQEAKDRNINKDVADGMEVTREMVLINKGIGDNTARNQDKLQQNTEVFKAANKGLQDNVISDYNREMVKYLANKNNLTEKTNAVDQNTLESTDKLIEHNGLIKDMTTAMIDENAEKLATQGEKYLSAQQSIHDKQNTVSADKPVIANSLGAEYPEGVSQESFTQNDENGLMKAIVTRRIVVIEGKGDVYVKTQTLGNITYSKNGNPTTERVWQKETQGPNLKKNY
jgi:epidermal growth factor receptor substrate 15